MTSRQRLKPTYKPLHRPALRIDERGFVYLGIVKVCHFANGLLSFQDRRGGVGQGKRIVEISPDRLAAELVRLTETAESNFDNGDGIG